jgi:hypothetical protein
VAEYNGVGSGGHRQHEGVAAAHGAGQHQVDRVQAQRQRHLGKDDFQNVLVREHEDVAAAHSAGQHQVDRVQAQRQRHLGKDDFQNVLVTVIKTKILHFCEYIKTVRL